MKKHTFIVFLLSVCMLVSFVGCGSKSKTFELNDIQKVVLTSSSGQVKNIITDTETIKQITENITSIQFSREKSSKDINGFGTIIEWYGNNDNRILSFFVNDEQTIQYDGYLWKAQNGSINTKLISGLLTSE